MPRTWSAAADDAADYDAGKRELLPWEAAACGSMFYNFSFPFRTANLRGLTVNQSLFRFFFLGLAMWGCAVIAPSHLQAELYEIRGYVLGENGDEAAVDKYISEALIPALKRQGIGPVGAFTNAANDETGIKTDLLKTFWPGQEE